MSTHLTYISILTFALFSWAHPVADLRLSTPKRSTIVALRRRTSPSRRSSFNVTKPLFDMDSAARELEKVITKYAGASQILDGIGLNPDTDAGAGYAPFNDTTTLVSKPTNASDALASQVSVEAELDRPVSIPSTPYAPNTMNMEDYFQTFDILYFGYMDFGAPPQSLSVDIDTGSSDLWVPVNCRVCPNAQYSPAENSTYQNSGKRASVSYGTGRVFGTLAQDQVSVGGLKVEKQDFIAVNVVSDQFASEPNSGLLGLAFGTIASSKKPTFFETLLAAHAIEAPIFSVHLTRGTEEGSQVCFGCYDKTKAVGPVSWLPVVSRTYWTIAMDGLSSDSEHALPTKLIAVIDTGTSLIYLPKDVAAEFYRMIPGAQDATDTFGEGFYTYPCSSQLSVSLSFSGKSFTIYAADFNLGPVDDDSDDCVGGIIGLGEGFDRKLAIIGDEFLKSWYSVYDYGESRVGLAPSTNNQ